MKILLLSRYSGLGASSRLRFYQYLPHLESSGVHIQIEPLLNDLYIQDLYAGRRKSIINIAHAYLKRIQWLVRASDFDLVWLEKEFLPWLPVWLELNLLPKHSKLIVDYDDAVFHQYDQHRSPLIRKLLGKKLMTVMRRADLIIAGNRYLADYAEHAGAGWVEILPTVVDSDRYQTIKASHAAPITVGWIGSPATAQYLRTLAPVMQTLTSTHQVRFIAVGANASQLDGLPITVQPWREDQEVAQIQQFDIGIMPLPDEAFARGKCGYKLIQYMACGKPVVASPVGANRDIVRDGVEGFWATSNVEWIAVLTRLIEDATLRTQMGNAGREQVEQCYSLHVMAPKLLHLLRTVLLK